jgi:hypothetical protein
VAEPVGRDLSLDRRDLAPGRELGVDPVHRRLVHLHTAREADRLIRRRPCPRRLGVVAGIELPDERRGRALAAGEQLLAGILALGAWRLRRVVALRIRVGERVRREVARPELVRLGDVPEEVVGGPTWAGWYVAIRVGCGKGGGCAIGFGGDALSC